MIPIYTIGYGARSLEEFIAVLQQYDIKYLADVRSKPYSRYKPEFSKAALKQAVEEHGIRYLFLGDTLGGQPDDPACYTADGKIDYELVKKQTSYCDGIARLESAYHQQHAVVLMCSEGKPEQCHRSKLIGVSLADLNIPVRHIDETDQVKDQDEVIEEVFFQLTKGQLSLFDEPTFTSRKRYQSDDQ